MSKIRNKERAAVQLIFLFSSVIIALIWCDALRRGTNDFFIPLLILLYVGVVTITAIPQILCGEMPGGAVWTYGAMSLAAIVMGGWQIIFNIKHGFSFLPSAAELGRLADDFGLVSLYRVITGSWIFALLHVIAALAGVFSIYMAVKERSKSY